MNGSEWTYSDSLDILNPAVLQEKGNLPLLLAASFILAVAVPIAQYYTKSKQPTNQTLDKPSS